MGDHEKHSLAVKRAGLVARREQLAGVDGSEPVITSIDALIAKIDRHQAPGRPARATVQLRAAPRMFEVARVPKTARAEIRVAIDARKPERKVDVRLWFVPKGAADLVPSRKGVTLAAADLAELIDALQLAQQHLVGPE